MANKAVAFAITDRFFITENGSNYELEIRGGKMKVPIVAIREIATGIFNIPILANEPEASVSEWRRHHMQYLFCSIVPTASSQQDDAVLSSVHCWIQDQNFENARHIVRGHLLSEGWDTVEVDDQRAVQREDFVNTDYLKYYDECLLSGEVYLIEVPLE